MAMTKTEKAAMRALEERIALVRAVAAMDEVIPPSMTHDEIKEALAPGGMKYGQRQNVARGWFAHSYGTGSVSYGCSDGYSHSSSGDVTTTQQPGCMYRTEAEAWRVVRRTKALEIAGMMAKIEEKLSASEAPHPIDATAITS